MKVRHGLIGIAAVLGVACLFTVVRGQVPPPDDDPGPFLVSYNERIITDPDARLIAQNLANTLNGYNVIPNDRLAYYAAVNNNNGCEISAWQGSITDFQANANGYLVTMSVLPTLSSEEYGPATLVLNSDYTEQFQVNNDGTFAYAGSFDPQGLAGLMPSLAGL